MYCTFDKNEGFVSNFTCKDENEKILTDNPITGNYFKFPDRYEFLFEVLTTENVSINLCENFLTVKYNKPEVVIDAKNAEISTKNIKSGEMKSLFNIDREIDESKIVCEFAKGLLHLILPVKTLNIPIVSVEKLNIETREPSDDIHQHIEFDTIRSEQINSTV